MENEDIREGLRVRITGKRHSCCGAEGIVVERFAFARLWKVKLAEDRGCYVWAREMEPASSRQGAEGQGES